VDGVDFAQPAVPTPIIEQPEPVAEEPMLEEPGPPMEPLEPLLDESGPIDEDSLSPQLPPSEEPGEVVPQINGPPAQVSTKRRYDDPASLRVGVWKRGNVSPSAIRQVSAVEQQKVAKPSVSNAHAEVPAQVTPAPKPTTSQNGLWRKAD
jgi:hypothetical protein